MTNVGGNYTTITAARTWSRPEPRQRPSVRLCAFVPPVKSVASVASPKDVGTSVALAEAEDVMTRDAQTADADARPVPPHYTGIVCRRCKQPVAEQIDEVTLQCGSCGYAWEPGPPVLLRAA